MKATRNIFVIYIILFVLGCANFGSQRILLNNDVTFEQYDQIRLIVVEEAAKNGFSELASEVVPSKHNDWNGQLYFKLKTGRGTDQLSIEFSRNGKGQMSLYMHGAGYKSNPDSAIKSIQERLNKEII
jgi:hypothetical protein